MYKRINFLCILILLLSTFSLSNTHAAVQNIPEQAQHYLKVIYEDKVLFHEKIDGGKYLEIYNASGDVISSEIFKGDKDVKLEKLENPEGKLLSYWAVEIDEKITITPVFIEKRSVRSGFIATDGGHLLHENSQIKDIVKNYKEGALFNEVAPQVNPEENYKFRGWFYYNADNKIQQFKVTDISSPVHLTTYYAMFYKDMNDNKIDDTTESVTLKFVTNSQQKIKDKNLYVGQPYSMPKLEPKQDHVFIGWYEDSSLSEKFVGDTPLLADKTLYAKWEKVEKIMEESPNNPITDKDISAQVESILNGRLDELEKAIDRVNQTASDNSQKSATVQTDKGGNVVNPPKENVELLPQPENEKPVEQPQPQQQSSNNSTSNNAESNEVLTYTETKYVFKNLNMRQDFLVKFYDENEKFLFSITLPYGQSIQVMNESENVVKEFFVRQDTTITLNVADYLLNSDELDKFTSQTVRVNETDVTQVFPIKRYVEPQHFSANVQNIQEETTEDDSNSTLFFALLAIVLIVCGATAYYLIQRKKKQQI